MSSLRKSANGRIHQVQVNGGMHPGNSGGPVIDGDGKVIGVAVSAIRATQINFAVPADYVRVFLMGRLSALITEAPSRTVKITSGLTGAARRVRRFRKSPGATYLSREGQRFFRRCERCRVRICEQAAREGKRSPPAIRSPARCACRGDGFLANLACALVIPARNRVQAELAEASHFERRAGIAYLLERSRLELGLF